MKFYFVCLFSWVLLGLAACQQKDKRAEGKIEQKTLADSASLISPRYAAGFKVTYTPNACLVDIQDPQNSEGESYHFALIPKGEKTKTVPEGYTLLETPVDKVICMTSLQLSNFIKLGQLEHVAGITSTRHLFNDGIKRQIEEGKTSKIGIEGNFDNEVIMAMNPDIILISPFKRGGYDALTEVGIPLIPHLGYKEMSPLGQAEWIKFIGLLLHKEKEANEQFAMLEKRYNELKDMASKVNKRPLVFSGELRGGNWYAVGGRNFLAQLFRDAGADYFLKDDPNTGGITLDFETVYSQAEQADYWRILNSYPGKFSYDILKGEDARYGDFKAFRDKGVIYCNLRDKPYYESAPTQPELLLQDLIKIFHPELLPDYEPVYYELLK